MGVHRAALAAEGRRGDEKEEHTRAGQSARATQCSDTRSVHYAAAGSCRHGSTAHIRGSPGPPTDGRTGARPESLVQRQRKSATCPAAAAAAAVGGGRVNVTSRAISIDDSTHRVHTMCIRHANTPPAPRHVSTCARHRGAYLDPTCRSTATLNTSPLHIDLQINTATTHGPTAGRLHHRGRRDHYSTRSGRDRIPSRVGSAIVTTVNIGHRVIAVAAVTSRPSPLFLIISHPPS